MVGLTDGTENGSTENAVEETVIAPEEDVQEDPPSSLIEEDDEEINVTEAINAFTKSKVDDGTSQSKLQMEVDGCTGKEAPCDESTDLFESHAQEQKQEELIDDAGMSPTTSPVSNDHVEKAIEDSDDEIGSFAPVKPEDTASPGALDAFLDGKDDE